MKQTLTLAQKDLIKAGAHLLHLIVQSQNAQLIEQTAERFCEKLARVIEEVPE